MSSVRGEESQGKLCRGSKEKSARRAHGIPAGEAPAGNPRKMGEEAPLRACRARFWGTSGIRRRRGAGILTSLRRARRRVLAVGGGGGGPGGGGGGAGGGGGGGPGGEEERRCEEEDGGGGGAGGAPPGWGRVESRWGRGALAGCRWRVAGGRPPGLPCLGAPAGVGLVASAWLSAPGLAVPGSTGDLPAGVGLAASAWLSTPGPAGESPALPGRRREPSAVSLQEPGCYQLWMYGLNEMFLLMIPCFIPPSLIHLLCPSR